MKEVVRLACPHDCPDTCAMLVEVEVDEGAGALRRAVRVRGNPDHPPTAGVLCAKVAHYLERVYHPQRLSTPLRRVGAKGEGRFEACSWDEALETIARRFAELAADHPESILPYHYAGTMGLVQSQAVGQRFFNRLGASILDETICAEAGTVGWKSTYGAMVGMDPSSFAHSKLILIWGANPVVSSVHLWRMMVEAKRQGARLVCIDPLRTETARHCHQHIAPLPGTDAALALAMMHVLIRENLIDLDYIARYTHGFEALKERVRTWTPERAASICDIPAAIIVELARAYGTTRPAAIRLNYGLQRTRGGGNAVRAIACLPALTGQWRDPAGGALLSCSGNFAVDTEALQRPDLRQWPSRHINMSQLGGVLLDRALDPPIRALYVYNSNPAAIAPDANAVRQGLMRDDLFVVVHDLFQTDTADFADIVLPATSSLEHADIYKPYGHLWALASNPAIPPLAGARSNRSVFAELAHRMGFTDPCFDEDDGAIAAQAFSRSDPRTRGFDWPTMQREGFQRLDLPSPFAPYAPDVNSQMDCPTPSGRIEFWSNTLAGQGLDPLPDFVAPWESVASAPKLAAQYPLALITPPARNFLNSSFANNARFLAEEGSPRIDLHPEDARTRGIGDGDWVRVFNGRGDFVTRARVVAEGLESTTRRGVVGSPSIWWHKLSPGGRNCNAVTSQALTDLGDGATFYDCLVEVKKCSDPTTYAKRVDASRQNPVIG